MELYFLGRGSAFFTEEGNTSAFFIEKETMFLIDCGESVFKKIREARLLELAQIKELYIFITHMHDDHVGSLGSLVSYCRFGFPEGKEVKCHLVCAPALETLLYNKVYAAGCAAHCDFITAEALDGQFRYFRSMRYIRTIHQPHFPAFSIEFNTNVGKVFYSGDTQDVDMVEAYAKQDDISRLYLEVCSERYPDNVHLPLEDLDRIIPMELRYKTYLMHFDNYKCIERAKKLGFQIVEPIH